LLSDDEEEEEETTTAYEYEVDERRSDGGTSDDGGSSSEEEEEKEEEWKEAGGNTLISARCYNREQQKKRKKKKEEKKVPRLTLKIKRGEEEEEERPGKKIRKLTGAKSREGIIDKKNKVIDVSQPTPKLIRDKFLLGDRYSVQIGMITVKKWSYECLIFTRDAPPGEPEKKAFSFNMPIKLIIPMRDALLSIISKNGANKIE
jgi:hypothetical protein